MLKRPSPGWKHTVLVISLVAFPFQDLFDAFVISVQQEHSASRPQECVQCSISISMRGRGEGTTILTSTAFKEYIGEKCQTSVLI